MKKTFLTVITLGTLLTASVRPATAVSIPEFGTCMNPQVKASQVNTGKNHGVVGTTKTYAGTDTIYNLSNGNVVQCLCPEDGKGIQTNWLKVNNMSKRDVTELKNKGWIYIITGSPWGLADTPYLAKNIEYTCKGIDGKGGGQVKGLATTGNSVAIYGLVLAGITSLLAGLLLRKVSK